MLNDQEATAYSATESLEDLPQPVANAGDENVIISDLVSKYLSEISSGNLLTASEEAELSCRIRKNGDIDAREELIKHNLRLVPWCARRFIWSELPFEDLVQEGNIGLIIASERFDSELGRFSNYAKWWIDHFIRRAIMNQTGIIRTPVHVVDLQRKIEKAKKLFTNAGVLRPSVSLLASHIGESNDKIKNALASHHSFDSIDETFEGGESKNANFQIRDDKLFSPETFVDSHQQLMVACESLQAICDAIANLPKVSERDIAMFLCYYGFNERAEQFTLDETGKLFGGLTRERVRQIVIAIWKKAKQSNIVGKEEDIRTLLWQIVELGEITGNSVKFKPLVELKP